MAASVSNTSSLDIYLLTAENSDFDHDARYMAFYPGASSREHAIQLDVNPGIRLRDVKFATFYEPLYTFPMIDENRAITLTTRS